MTGIHVQLLALCCCPVALTHEREDGISNALAEDEEERVIEALLLRAVLVSVPAEATIAAAAQ